jgi:23S rRNA (uracil1939-C5)-methyltransferase
MKAECIKMGINGEGIAYIDQKPVFIPGLLPGETADIQITEDNRSFKRAKPVRITRTSPYRRKPASEEEYLSGGAELAILDYEQQLYWKNALLEEALWKYGHVNRKLIRDMHASPSPTGYRNECKLPVGLKDGKLAMGLYRTGSNHFIPVEHFSTHTRKLEEIRLQVLEILQNSRLKPFDIKTGHGLRFVVIRCIQNQCQLTLVTGKDQISQTLIDELAGIEHMVTVAQSINDRRKTTGIFGATKILAGSETICIEMHGLNLRLSPESFFPDSSF